MSRCVNSASECRSLSRRKKSSAELGFSYPGDLLSQARPRRTGTYRPLVKRNTVDAFANGSCRQTTPLATLLSTVEPGRCGYYWLCTGGMPMTYCCSAIAAIHVGYMYVIACVCVCVCMCVLYSRSY